MKRVTCDKTSTTVEGDRVNVKISEYGAVSIVSDSKKEEIEEDTEKDDLVKLLGNVQEKANEMIKQKD